MLSEHVSVALGYQAILQDSLSKMPTPSTMRNAHSQLLLLQESLRGLESTLTELLDASKEKNSGSASN